METYSVKFYAYYKLLGLSPGSQGGGEADITVTVTAPSEQEAVRMGTEAIGGIKSPKANWGPFRNIRHRSTEKVDLSKPAVLGVRY